MKLPASVTVGHRTFRIVELSRAEHHKRQIDGECVFATGTIKVRLHGQTGPQVANTLWHEIDHAIWAEAGLGKRPGEERTVTVLANFWVRIIRDNPDVFTWITEQARA